MRRTLAIASVLAMLVGAVVASVATFVLDGRGQLTIEGVDLTFAVTGGTGQFRKARGQLHETFLPSGEFRFAFALYQ